MLISQYEGKLSEKQQVSFPKKFREILGDTIIITKGPDQQLIIVSQKESGILLEGTEGKPFINRSAREVQRFLLGNATEIELDSKGRFVVPEYLRDYAGIKKDVIFAGLRSFVEMWDKDAWEKQQEHLAQNILPITNRLSGDEKADE